MKKTLKCFIILSLLLCLGACAPKRNDYSEFKILNPQGWAYGDTLVYDVTHGDSILVGDLYLSLRHTNDYLYSNLWLEVTFSDSNKIKYIDTLNIKLADVYGNWSGKGVGISFQKQILVKRRLSHVKGKAVNVRHIMRTDTLRGIELLGIDFVGKED